ncbi:MAG: VCBS repeat-containing protein [Opitutaceae bacterium]
MNLVLKLIASYTAVTCVTTIPAYSQEELSGEKKIAEYLTASVLNSLPESADAPRFTRVDGETIGLVFSNFLKDENIKNYITSGAGMTVADVDGNGLPDFYLVSQDGPSKFFLQTAPWKFEDRTKASGLDNEGLWGSGAAFVDIENDGDLDLYVCNKAAHDQLFLNQGDATFVEQHLGSGDASLRAATMAAFSDYDLDGDLDYYLTSTRLYTLSDMFGGEVYLANDPDSAFGGLIPDPRHNGEFILINGAFVEVGTEDYLFRNELLSNAEGFQFTDVTSQAGIRVAREHGLAALWWDYNNDNLPDLNVANDFHTPDHMYHNNGDGTFTDLIEEAFPYTSWYSMGNDFGDLNNDGWLDFVSTDMSATTHFKQKAGMGAMADTAWFLDHLEPRQYMRNALHVNTGTGKFIDIAFHAGVDSTDWTWSGLFGDLDNDGLEDIYFTNGMERNLRDVDSSARMSVASKEGATPEEIHQMWLDTPVLAELNLAFKNVGGFEFENVTEAWGMPDLSVSKAGVLVDLDRDGDLDIVVNNSNEPLGIFRNNSETNHAILVSLRGTASNSFGLGTRVEVELSDGQRLTRMMTSSRGYMTGVEPVLHFGLGDNERFDSMRITWPSGRIQTFEELEAGLHYTVTETAEATIAKGVTPTELNRPLFAQSADCLDVKFSHKENFYNDFGLQPLLPNRLSRFGPALAVGDANGDGLPDLYFGAAAGLAPELYVQEQGGDYRSMPLPFAEADKHYEDVAAAWIDTDLDGDLDLYVVSGGASEPDQDEHYLDRLYLNDGSGVLMPAENRLPELKNSGMCVVPCDFDGDGDIDLFVGSRHVAKRYPTAPESSLLINKNGRFTKADSPVNQAGMVTDATWADVNGDARPDLLVATEWGPVKIFLNMPDGMIETTEQAGLQELTGWWNCVAAGDFDQDGDIDFMAGNFGTNTKYHVKPGHPATLFASDFGDQGQLQLVEAKSSDGKLLPIRGRSCSTTAMPHLKTIAPTYTDFACMSLTDLYSEDSLEGAIKLEAKTLKSMVFLNDGTGSFSAEPLPFLAQMSPVMDIAIGDFDGDGFLDAALGQNFNDAQRETGRMNAGLGVILKGSSEGGFTELWPLESGFHQRTNLRAIEAVDLNQDGLLDLISANNSGKPTLHLGQAR